MPKAAGLAEALNKQFNVESKLIEGAGGVFEVRVDGSLVWSKKDTGRFPEQRELAEKIRTMISRG